MRSAAKETVAIMGFASFSKSHMERNKVTGRECLQVKNYSGDNWETVDAA